MHEDTLHFSGGFNVGFEINMQSNSTDRVRIIGVDATVSPLALATRVSTWRRAYAAYLNPLQS